MSEVHFATGSSPAGSSAGTVDELINSIEKAGAARYPSQSGCLRSDYSPRQLSPSLTFGTTRIRTTEFLHPPNRRQVVRCRIARPLLAARPRVQDKPADLDAVRSVDDY